jgi:hypothetical protein
MSDSSATGKLILDWNSTAGGSADTAYHRDFVQWLREYHITGDLTEEQVYHSRALERAAKVIEALFWRARSAEARCQAMQNLIMKTTSMTIPDIFVKAPAATLTEREDR